MTSLTSQRTKPLILIADDEIFQTMQLRLALEQEKYEVVVTNNGAECLQVYQRLHPDLILLDAMMPVMDGFTCCAELQKLPKGDRIPILIITGLDDTESIDRAFAAGAADYITKPLHWPVMRQRVRRLLQQSQLYQQLEQANHQLERLASLDGLTGIANRRCFDAQINQEWQRMAREQMALSLILCDIDFFKPFNDTYGHQAGDQCLKQVAEAMYNTIKRPADLAARYGGEEFAILLPGTDLQGAVHVAEEIRAAVKALEIVHQQSPIGYVTISQGVTSVIPSPNLLPRGLIAAADQALYQAKAEGRDRVVQTSDINLW